MSLSPDEVAGRLHHKPGALCGAVPRSVSKLQGITLEEMTPEESLRMKKHLQDFSESFFNNCKKAQASKDTVLVP